MKNTLNMKNTLFVLSFVLCTFFSSLVLAQKATAIDGSNASLVANANGTSVVSKQIFINSAFNPKAF